MAVQPIPAGYHSLTPYLIVEGADRAIAWYAEAFGATETMRLNGPGDRVAHAEIRVGDSALMLGDANPDWGAKAPGEFGGSPVTLHLYVPDVDATVARAVAAGAVLERPVANQFYGDRAGMLRDPFGHAWHVATHVEDVPPGEIERRFAASAGGA